MNRFQHRDMFREVAPECCARLVMFGTNPWLDKAIGGGALGDQQS